MIPESLVLIVDSSLPGSLGGSQINADERFQLAGRLEKTLGDMEGQRTRKKKE